MEPLKNCPHGINPNRCSICKASNEQPRFFCPECSREFGNMGALKSHMKTHKEPSSEIINLPEFPKDDLEILENPARALQSAIERAKPSKPVVVKVKKLPHGLGLPELKRGTAGAAAVDLYAAVDDVLWLGAQSQAIPPVPTGIAVEIPEGYHGKVVPRSGLAAKNGISIVNSPGIIDCDYRGEIMITLINTSQHKFKITRGDRVAQMLIEKVESVQFEYVTELSETARGEGGFGSTGVSSEIVAFDVDYREENPVTHSETVERPTGKTVRRAF